MGTTLDLGWPCAPHVNPTHQPALTRQNSIHLKDSKAAASITPSWSNPNLEEGSLSKSLHRGFIYGAECNVSKARGLRFAFYLPVRAVLSCCSRVWLTATLWTIAHQAPLSMGILQARILEGVAISSSRGSYWLGDWTRVSSVSCIDRWVLYH